MSLWISGVALRISSHLPSRSAHSYHEREIRLRTARGLPHMFQFDGPVEWSKPHDSDEFTPRMISRKFENDCFLASWMVHSFEVTIWKGQVVYRPWNQMLTSKPVSDVWLMIPVVPNLRMANQHWGKPWEISYGYWIIHFQVSLPKITKGCGARHGNHPHGCADCQTRVPLLIMAARNRPNV